MAFGILIDPVAKTTSRIEVDLSDYLAIQDAIGGLRYETHTAVDKGKSVGRIFMVEDRAWLPSQESFSFDEFTVLGQTHKRVYGTALFVSDNAQSNDSYPEVTFYTHAEAKAPAEPVIHSLSDIDMRNWFAKLAGGDPNQTFVRRIPEREPREFIPRPVGTFRTYSCSVAELEAAFLGFHEWLRKGGRTNSLPNLSRAFEAPPFFFPGGLDSTDEEFDAGVEVEAGRMSLPFPMSAFWIVHWDHWVGGDGSAAEGPVLLYVEEREFGFTTVQTFCKRGGKYAVGEAEHHVRLRQTPGALVTALHRLNNRRVVIERDVFTPQLERANSGRAKSKRHLPPLPTFIRVTGEVHVTKLGRSTGTGVERSRHDRRAHWRKRRRGVELPPHQWVRVRSSTIHPDKPERPLNPYVVV